MDNILDAPLAYLSSRGRSVPFLLTTCPFQPFTAGMSNDHKVLGTKGMETFPSPQVPRLDS